jgi:hypothetical protein
MVLLIVLDLVHVFFIFFFFLKNTQKDVLIKQLGKARINNAAKEHNEEHEDVDKGDGAEPASSSSSSSSSLLGTKKAVVSTTSGHHEMYQHSQTKSVLECVAASLLHALKKVKDGAVRNCHGGTHVDLRGFQGEDMTKDMFLRELRTQLGIRLTTHEADILFYYFDSDHGGTVSFIEILQKLSRPGKYLSLSLKEALAITDQYLSNQVGSQFQEQFVRTTTATHASRSSVIDLDTVEQLRLRLKVACTTFKGLEPLRIFKKWVRKQKENVVVFWCFGML